jgi:hypothetical protein
MLWNEKIILKNQIKSNVNIWVYDLLGFFVLQCSWEIHMLVTVWGIENAVCTNAQAIGNNPEM